MRKAKRILKGLLLILVLGFLFGFAAAFWGMDPDTLNIAVIAACILYIAVILVYYFAFCLPYRKRVLRQAEDMEYGRAEEALADIRHMMEEPRVRHSRYLMNCCRINLSAACCHLDRYDLALETLRAMPAKKLKGDFELVYHLNTCICLFYIVSEQEGLTYYQIHEKLFHAYRKHRYYGGNLAVLQCWARIAQGDAAGAESLLEQARKNWTKPSLQDAYEKLERRLADAEDP